MAAGVHLSDVIRVEHLPLVLGILVAVAGAALVWDARREDGVRRWRERRRRRRTPRHRPGEALIGLGTIALGASLIGGEFWRYGTVAVLAGFTLVATGTLLNRQYLRELLLFRGAARRASGEERATLPDDDDSRPRPRIR